ncbi:hypothetical protein TNCV_4346771 [Trichonephila clavipes]|nr:hypothetical protein TNCV_4346771 [Trichonephila clavipes]
MSLCGMKFYACLTCCVNTGMESAGCGWCWSFRPMIPHTCSIGYRYVDLAGPSNISTLCTARYAATVGSMSKSQSVWLQAFPWSPSPQHTTITGTKAELVSIIKHKRFPLHPVISSGLKPLSSQIA